MLPGIDPGHNTDAFGLTGNVITTGKLHGEDFRICENIAYALGEEDTKYIFGINGNDELVLLPNKRVERALISDMRFDVARLGYELAMLHDSILERGGRLNENV